MREQGIAERVQGERRQRGDDDARHVHNRLDEARGVGARGQVDEGEVPEGDLQAGVVIGAVAVRVPAEGVGPRGEDQGLADCGGVRRHGAARDDVALQVGDGPGAGAVAIPVVVVDHEVLGRRAGVERLQRGIGEELGAHIGEWGPLTHGEFVFPAVVGRPFAHGVFLFFLGEECCRVEDLDGHLGEVVVILQADLPGFRDRNGGVAIQGEGGGTEHAVVVVESVRHVLQNVAVVRGGGRGRQNVVSARFGAAKYGVREVPRVVSDAGEGRIDGDEVREIDVQSIRVIG